MPRRKPDQTFASLPRLLVKKAEAAWMLSASEGKLAEFGAKPSVRGHGLVLYDVRELKRVADELARSAGMEPKERWKV